MRSTNLVKNVCTLCEGTAEPWGPLSIYFDFTPCFLYGVLFNFLGVFAIVFCSIGIYKSIFKTNISLKSNLYKFDTVIFVRLFLILFQIVLKVISYFADSDYYQRIAVIRSLVALETFSLTFFVLPFTFIDFKKYKTTSSILLVYWLMALLFHAFKFVNVSIRYNYGSDLTVSKYNIFFTCLNFFISILILILQALPKRVNVASLTNEERYKKFVQKENPLDSSNLLSIFTFGWMSGLMKLGYSKFLNLDDLPALPKGFSNEETTNHLNNTYQKEFSKKKKKASLFKCILTTFGDSLLVAAVFKVGSDIMSFSQPQLLKILIKFVNEYNNPKDLESRPPLIKGFNIALAMLLVSTIQTTCINQYFFTTYSTGIKIKSSLTGAVYNKSMKLSSESRNVKSTGDIVNLMSIDTQRLQNLTEFGQVIWSAPFQIVLCLISLYNLLGNSMWFGFGIMALMVLVNTSLVRIQKRLQQQQMKYKDSRIKVVSEILSNIKSLKLYNWEIPYKNKLNYWRNDKELKNLSYISYFKAINMSMWNMIPCFVSCCTFYGFIKIYNLTLTTDIVFPALALFNLLGFPLNVIPNVITAFIDASVSVTRLNEFLQLDELDPTIVSKQPSAKNKGDVAIEFDNCSFSWAKNGSNLLALKNIDFVATKGELSTIIGKVGSGKSSFIKSVFGDLYKFGGKVTTHGKIAYVSQASWIMNGSIKENILFGHRFDSELYEKVLEACDLKVDLRSFMDGDNTQVGEKGISLSGGQKARISLARAVYSGADLYLLDDPLSAVDENVGKHLIDHVFGVHGLLANKCKVLVTNSIHFLSIADKITLLEEGKIAESVTRQELKKLLKNKNGDSKIAQLIQTFGKSKNDSQNDEPQVKDNGKIVSATDEKETDVNELVLEDSDSLSEGSSDTYSLRRQSTISAHEYLISYDNEDEAQKKRREHLERGKVKWDVYLAYAKACNAGYVVFFLILAVITMLLNVLSNYWLKHWSEINSRAGYNPDVLRYLSVYILLGVAGSITLMLQCIILWNVCVIEGSRNLHNILTNSVMRAPMSFFETTPIGRILNRFSNDINKVDELLGRVFQSFFQQFIKIFFTIIVICMSTWQFLFVMLFLSFLYIYYQRFYMRTSRELKRLESVTRSPIFAHFQESLNGITTIRGFGQEKRFIKLNEIKIDNNLGAYHPTVNCNRWLATRLEFLGSLVLFFAAAMPMFQLANGSVSAGLVGLSVSYALQITGALNWTVRMTVEVETNIVSVERIEEYAQIKPEAPEIIADSRPPKGWPSKGSIEFKDYSTKYREELDLVLKKINLRINPSEKIGIVGRTGAGKSSLTMALYRIIEPAHGEILIDGISTSKIGLSDLRKALSIIPQDAQVFEGTIKENLDPTYSYDDEKILKAIELSHLTPHLERIANEQNNNAEESAERIVSLLDVKVTENGGNLSAGQRQLMCLARALLIPARILVLDEATAAVDVETDKIVQETIRTEFKERTILTIAHRINTIMDNDRILVLEKGEVAEFDKPEVLLKNKNSIFYSLAQRGGLVE